MRACTGRTAQCCPAAGATARDCARGSARDPARATRTPDKIGGLFDASPDNRMIELNPVRQRIADLTGRLDALRRSEEHTSELQSLMRSSYAVFCLKKKTEQPMSAQQSCHTHNTNR